MKVEVQDRVAKVRPGRHLDSLVHDSDVDVGFRAGAPP